MREMPVSRARDELADALNAVAYGSEPVVLTRRNRPLAAIVCMEDFRRLQELRALEDAADGAEAARVLGDPGTKLSPWEEARERLAPRPPRTR